MPHWRLETEEVVARELGGAVVGWTDWDEALAPSVPTSPMVLNAVGRAIGADERSRVLSALAAASSAGDTLVVVDHNRPRRLVAAVAAVLGPPAVPGGSPAARWRRLAGATARALEASGFRVERLRLAAGERVQVVIATRTRVAAPDVQGSTTVDGTQRSRGPKNGN